MIELDLNDFGVNVNKSGIYFQDLNYFLQKNDYIESNESFIRVAATENIIPDSSFSFINVLSIVCACLSAISLIITLSVYGLLTGLRTQPGLNNMSLSVAFSRFIGGIQSVSGLWCSLIGLPMVKQSALVKYYTIIDFNEVDIRIYLPDKNYIHRGR